MLFTCLFESIAPLVTSPETSKESSAYNWALSFYRDKNKHEYYSFISMEYLRSIFSKLGKYGTFLKVTLPLPKGALPLQNKLEYYVTLMHTECTLLCSTHCSSAPFFYKVLHTIQTFYVVQKKQINKLNVRGHA